MIKPEEAKFFVCHLDVKERKFPIVGIKNMNLIVQGPIIKFVFALHEDSLTKFRYEIRGADGKKAAVDDVIRWWEEMKNDA